jgi:hypothetical protein
MLPRISGEEAGMSSAGTANATIKPQASNYHLLHRIVSGAAILLCLLGVSVSIIALARILVPHKPPFGIDALFEYPVWGAAHFLPGLLFMTLVPLQLWAGLRNRHRVFHRWSGRMLVAAGVFLGVSGAAFPFFMSGRAFSERVVISTFFLLFFFFLSKAFIAARRRDFVRHREWMIRWFAIALAISTQRILLPVFIVTAGVTDARSFWEIFVSATWLATAIQVLIAEWWISSTKCTDLAVKATV